MLIVLCSLDVERSDSHDLAEAGVNVNLLRVLRALGGVDFGVVSIELDAFFRGVQKGRRQCRLFSRLRDVQSREVSS